MKRILAFVILLLAFTLWTFPHRVLVERWLRTNLADVPVDVRLGEVTLAWPLGYRIRDLEAMHDPYHLRVDSLYLDLLGLRSLNFEADLCGGLARGSLRTLAPETEGKPARAARGRRLELTFTDADPARCLELADLRVSGTFGGELQLDGLGGSSAKEAPASYPNSGRLVIEGKSGTVSGNLPSAGMAAGKKPQPGTPIGEWTFTRAELNATLSNGDLLLERAHADAEGVAWELTKGRAQIVPGRQVRINADLRVRRLDDSGRSKGILGMLPKSGEDSEGWRHYRLAGSLDAPRLIGLKQPLRAASP